MEDISEGLMVEINSTYINNHTLKTMIITNADGYNVEYLYFAMGERQTGVMEITQFLTKHSLFFSPEANKKRLLEDKPKIKDRLYYGFTP